MATMGTDGFSMRFSQSDLSGVEASVLLGRRYARREKRNTAWDTEF